MKNMIDELAAYRLKVERDGKEIVNVPGILALPGVLAAPKMSIIGTVAASLLGCSIRLESEDGKNADIGKAVKDAAETVADTAATTARTIKEEIEKAWNGLSADDPEECPVGKENEEDPADQEPADQDSAEDGVPTIQVDPEDSEKE